MEKSPKPQEDHFKYNDFLANTFIGMSDGLTIPFILAAGLSAVADTNSTIVIAGFAALAVGSVAMGLGGYQAGKSELAYTQSELKREYNEIEKDTGPEEVKKFFANIGLSEAMQEKAAEELLKDKKQWVDFMKKYELSVDSTDPKRAAKSALTIGLSYIAGGLITLSPYFFTNPPLEALKISMALTITCLLFFGFFKSRFAGQNPFWGALRVTLTAAMAAAAAFGVARLF